MSQVEVRIPCRSKGVRIWLNRLLHSETGLHRVTLKDLEFAHRGADPFGLGATAVLDGAELVVSCRSAWRDTWLVAFLFRSDPALIALERVGIRTAPILAAAAAFVETHRVRDGRREEHWRLVSAWDAAIASNGKELAALPPAVRMDLARLGTCEERLAYLVSRRPPLPDARGKGCPPGLKAARNALLRWAAGWARRECGQPRWIEVVVIVNAAFPDHPYTVDSEGGSQHARATDMRLRRVQGALTDAEIDAMLASRSWR